MTKLLEKAFAQIAQLPETEQDSIACRILEEIEDEERWMQQFSNSVDILSHLAQNDFKRTSRRQDSLA